MFFYRKQSGVAALVAVLVTAAAGLVLAISASLLSLDSLTMTSDRVIGNQALSLADSCLNLGYRRLQLDNNYSGESLSVGSGSCIITVSGSSPVFVVRTIASLENYNRAIEAQIQLTSTTVNILQYSYLNSY